MYRILEYEIPGIQSIPALEEIRIRAGKHVVAYGNTEYVLERIFSQEELAELVFKLSKHSLYAYLDELKRGYFTVDGGIRVGVAGRVITEAGNISLIKDFTSVSIRFPNDIGNIAKNIIPYLITTGDVRNTLIISAPRHGKTTLLRDIVRELSMGKLCKPKTCAVIDERCEISGNMRFDLGPRTDVLLGCPKASGMSMALRTLSPDVIATDELGMKKEFEAAEDAANSGVCVLTTAHAGSLAELKRRAMFQEIENFFACIILLSDRLGRTTVEQVYIDGHAMLKFPFLLRGETIC